MNLTHNINYASVVVQKIQEKNGSEWVTFQFFDIVILLRKKKKQNFYMCIKFEGDGCGKTRSAIQKENLNLGLFFA